MPVSFAVKLPKSRVMTATMLPKHRKLWIGTALAALLAAPVPVMAQSNIYQRMQEKDRYDSCLRQAAGNPAAALVTATGWTGGGAPAQHCAAVALTGLKRYAEAAAKLDGLGRAAGMGELRPSLFDQAGNAWMLAGEISKAIMSFQSALALSANDPDLYADLARAQAMQADWPEVESDLTAALSLAPRRADLLILRASARHAQKHMADARKDIEAALALSPKNPEGLVERGSIRRDSGDLNGARQDFQLVLALKAAPQTLEAARRNLAALEKAGKGAPQSKPVPKKK